LASRNVPEAVKKFEITIDHEIPVLESLEWLLEGNFHNFQDYAEEKSVTKISQSTFARYQQQAQEAPFILRNALLLHDLVKGRNMPEPHSETGADLLREIQPAILPDILRLNNTTDHSIFDLIVWLVRYHDTLGNIYTGEREPSFLIDILAGLPNPNQNLRLLQVMMLCDIRGTKNGRYLTENRARYWLELSDKEAIQRKNDELFDWRVERWTGNLIGNNNPQKAKKVLAHLNNKSKSEYVREVFGLKITRVVYGFYLFVDLSEDELATLMTVITNICMARPTQCKKIILEFEPYKPWEANASEILNSYRNQLQDEKPIYRWNNCTLTIYASSTKTLT
jgi:hypothetical protein